MAIIHLHEVVDMASKKFAKGSDEWMMFMDFWNLCQKFWISEDADEYYEQLIKENNFFYEKYKHLKLSKEIASAFLQAMIGDGENGKK